MDADRNINMAIKKTHEELLIENAILKYNERVSEMLDSKLKPLLDNQATIEDEVAKIKIDIEELQETVRPFTTFRRRLWQGLIFFILGTASIAFIVYEINRFRG